MLFRMVPKQLSVGWVSIRRFRAVLFRMVPKLFQMLLFELVRFRAVLFRMVPKLNFGECEIHPVF